METNPIRQRATANDIEQRVTRYMLFAVKDEKSQAFHTVLTHEQVNVAIRSFQAAASNTQSFLHLFPADYSLYYIADYDERSGTILPLEKPQFIIRADEALMMLQRTQIQVPAIQSTSTPELKNAN